MKRIAIVLGILIVARRLDGLPCRHTRGTDFKHGDGNDEDSEDDGDSFHESLPILPSWIFTTRSAIVRTLGSWVTITSARFSFLARVRNISRTWVPTTESRL